MTGAGMWETETLYSALGKEGRMGDRGSEKGRKASGMTFCSLSLPPTPPRLSPPPPSPHPPYLLLAPFPLNPGDAHLLGILGRTHTQVYVSVCLCMWTCETAEQSRSVKQTDMHVRLPWIRHPGTPLLFFLFNSYFLTVFYYCYFLILFEYVGS